jgi:hypothetical protein
MKSRVLLTVKQIGWINGAAYALSLLLQALSGGSWRLFKYQIVAQAVPLHLLCGKRGRHVAVQRFHCAADMPADFPRRPDVIAQRYVQRAECLAAFCRGEFAGCLWLCTGPYQEDEVRARFVPAAADAVWDFDVNVLPEHRFGLVFARLWDEANLLLAQRGVRWSCSRISAFNRASMAAHARIGTIRLGHAVFLNCGNWQWMASSLAPHFHLSRSPESFPQFRLETPCPLSRK